MKSTATLPIYLVTCWSLTFYNNKCSHVKNMPLFLVCYYKSLSEIHCWPLKNAFFHIEITLHSSCSESKAREPSTEPLFISYSIWPMECQNENFLHFFPFFIPFLTIWLSNNTRQFCDYARFANERAKRVSKQS